ncbi:MAG: 2-oxoglutarate-dependent dioxygenase [Comamonadaceae bacterium]|nr:MAG: 2-oxoglutarate-dependent dioxygenase [Comamonadaceae bacterium]
MSEPADPYGESLPSENPQDITPELRDWITAQTVLGHDREALLAAMVDAGWSRGAASGALDATGPASHAARPDRKLHQPASPLTVPRPDVSAGQLQVDAGDRQVSVLMTMQEPDITLFGGLLDDEECNALMDAARRRLTRSLTVEVKTGGEELNDDRTSQGMFFARGENALIDRIEARIARLLDWPVENGEGLQVLRYGPGAEYKPHYDYFDPAEPGTPAILQRGGQRVATLIIYLNEPESGGATLFPDVRLQVAPQRGNAVFFSYSRPHPGSHTLHGGAPVQVGEKWIATKWLREREFN